MSTTDNRTVNQGRYSKSELPLIKKEDYEVSFNNKPCLVVKTFYRRYSTKSESPKGDNLSPNGVSEFLDGKGYFSLKIIKHSGYNIE